MSQRIGPNKRPTLTPDMWVDRWSSTPWNQGFFTAAAAATPTNPVGINLWGCSTGSGIGASNWFTTSAFALLRSQIIARFGGLYGDLFPEFYHPSNGQSGQVLFSDGLNGNVLSWSAVQGWIGIEAVNSGATVNYHQSVTIPYACSSVDLWYLDLVAGTWKYSVKGGGDQTVTTIATSDPTKAQVKKINLAGPFAPGDVITWGKQSGAAVAIVTGIFCYALTPGNCYFSWLTVPQGGALFGYGFQGTTAGQVQSPYDRLPLLAGLNPQISYPPVHHFGLSAPTLNSQAAGNVPIGTWDYALTATGNQGANGQIESQLGPILTGVVVVTSAKAVTLNIAVDSASNQNAILQSTTARNLYRRVNPAGVWGKVASVADNTTLTIVDNAAAGGAAPPGTDPTYPVFGTIGVPFQNVGLWITEYGIDDLIGLTNMESQQSSQGVMDRFISAVRRGSPGCSILIFGGGTGYTYTDLLSQAGSFQGPLSNPQPLGYAIYAYHRIIAERYNCAYADLQMRWWPLLAHFFNLVNMHPNDSGHLDIFNQWWALVNAQY